MSAINYHKVASLPAVVRGFCYSNDAWIVGSYAKYLLDLSAQIPRDIDLLIPFYCWGEACKTIPVGTPTNSHGGVKLVTTEIVMDVWAGDIGWFLSQVPAHPQYAVQPKTMTVLITSKAITREK